MDHDESRISIRTSAPLYPNDMTLDTSHARFAKCDVFRSELTAETTRAIALRHTVPLNAGNRFWGQAKADK